MSPPMTATGTSSPVDREGRSAAAWVSVLCLVAFVALVVFLPGLRSLVARAGREILAMPPESLALVAVLKTGQALLSSLSWRNALRSAWPAERLAYRFVLGIDQGQDVVNTVLPGRAGTWAMLGAVRGVIPGAPLSTLLATWGVHNLAFMVFAMLASVVATTSGASRASGGPFARVSGFVTARPVLTTAVAIPLVIALAVVAVRRRDRLAELGRQVRAGMAILRSPSRYVTLLFLPALGSSALRVAASAVLLHAYGIPVTVETVALALGSSALAGAVRITPGGLGTTQLADVVALGPFAAPEVITAWSLAQIALNGLIGGLVAIAALASLAGWSGTRRLLAHLRRGELAAGLRAVGARHHRRDRGTPRRRP